jgi:protein DJ-1
VQVGALLRAQEVRGGLVAAVCAGPLALLAHGVYTGRRLTSYPALRAQLEAAYAYSEAAVEEDGPLVTSRGPGTSFQWGLALLRRLVGEERAGEVARAMLVE